MCVIEIDCKPGPIRPDNFFRVICNEIGIEYYEPVSKLFGNWTWGIDHLTPEQKKVYDEFVPGYLKSLYERGLIRYASW